MPAPSPIVMFHGTSSVNLASIMACGLRAPETEAARLTGNIPGNQDPHLASLDGVYVAADLYVSESFSEKSVKLFGGEPIVAVLVVDPLDTVPDEDHILEFLSNYGEDLPHIFESVGFLSRWRADLEFRSEVAAKMAADLIKHLKPSATGDVTDAMARLLNFGISAMDDAALQDAIERNGHHLSPALLENAIYADGGLATYRVLMDDLCRSMRGTQPFYSVEDHSLRAVSGIGFQGRTRIVGIGSPDRPFSIYAGDLDDEVLALLEEAAVESPGRATAVPA